MGVKNWLEARVKPLEEQHLPLLQEKMELIQWHLKEHEAAQHQASHYAQTIKELQFHLETKDDAEALLCSELLAKHQAQMVCEQEQMVTHFNTAKVLQLALTRWIAEQYHVDARLQWHIDLPNKMLVRMPEPGKKSKVPEDEETVVLEVPDEPVND